MDIALLLIALGMGFKVLSEASLSKQMPIRVLGYLTGILILTLGSFLLITQVLSGNTCSKMSSPMGMSTGSKCPMPHQGMGMYGDMKDYASPHGGGMMGFKHPPISDEGDADSAEKSAASK